MIQVHHIIPKSEGGTDDFDNLIAICMPCHSEVHTMRPFTRRFTANELREHRSEVIRLVENGTLPGRESTDETIIQDIMLKPSRISSRLSGRVALPPKAIEILIATAQDVVGRVLFVKLMGKCSFNIGAYNVDVEYGREEAEYEDAIERLVQVNYLARVDSGTDLVCRLTHEGYIAADELESLEAMTTV